VVVETDELVVSTARRQRSARRVDRALPRSRGDPARAWDSRACRRSGPARRSP